MQPPPGWFDLLNKRTNVIHATSNTEKGALLKTACGLPAYTDDWLRRPCDVEIVRYVNTLKIPAYAHGKRTELIEFGRAQGLEALERQVELGKATHRCCWEPKDGPHHPVCASKRKARAAA